MHARQKIVTSGMFTQVAKKLGLRPSTLSIVETIDSLEHPMVIINSEVTEKLGFIDNENRLNMACTVEKMCSSLWDLR